MIPATTAATTKAEQANANTLAANAKTELSVIHTHKYMNDIIFYS